MAQLQVVGVAKCLFDLSVTKTIGVRTMYERLTVRHSRNSEYFERDAFKQNERLPIIFLNM